MAPGVGTTPEAQGVAAGVPVPDWAIATGCSVIEDVAGVPQAASGTAENVAPQGHSNYATCSNVSCALQLSSSQTVKSGRRSTSRFGSQNPAPESAGSRSRPSSKPAKGTEQSSDNAAPASALALSPNGGSRSQHKPGNTPGNESPFLTPGPGSSVVPDIPAAWQAAAGLRSSSLTDTNPSCCPGLMSSLDMGNSGGGGARIGSIAWWRALGLGLAVELKKMTAVARSRPVVLLPGLAVLAVVLGLGLWALIAASASETRFRHEAALKIANDKALYIQTELDKTFMPAYVVSTTVHQNPSYYPPQPADLHTRFPNPWYLVNDNFDDLSKDLIALVKAGSVRTVSAIPHGVIRTMYPLKGNSVADDRNWGAVGKNWLNDSANAVPVKLSLSSRNLTIIGPYNLTQGGIGIVGMQAIFVAAGQNDTFGIPPGPDNATGPTSSIPGMLDLIWQPSRPQAPRFWGLVTVLISWDALRENVTRLQDLEEQGYDYVLTRPAGSAELAVAWSSGVDPPRPPGFDEDVAGVRPLLYYDLPKALFDPVVVKVPLPNVEWTLYVTRADGWKPTWRNPLIAMVVILSLVLSVLVFAVLVSRLQQRRLFRDVVEAAGKLAQTTRTLEEEKNRMQALLARHYDLIDLLEGGGGTLAASINGTAGGGGPDSGGDGGARSRLDILRQKMLLTGTSLRRDQLGEAEQVTIQELLGEGTFGKVYKGLWRGTEVAIKTIVLPAGMSGKEKREKMAVMEAAISSSLAHPNIVQTYTYHIRPLRDSSTPAANGTAAATAVAAVAPPPPSSRDPSPYSTCGGTTDSSVQGGGGGGGADATVDVSDCEKSLKAIGASADAVGKTQILAEQGAIVVGSPDSSVSTLMSTADRLPTDAPAAAAASRTPCPSPAPSPAPAALAAPAPAATPAGGNPPANADGVGPRGVSLDHTSNQGGIHSYEVQLVLEYCDRGCLRDALDAGVFFSQDGLNYPAILETAADVAKALLHLHLNDVLHSDLKATNVMLKSAGANSGGRGVVAKVADFGLSVRLDHTATHVSHAFQGSLTHMAPEVMLQGHVSRAADVYAFGITMWEIFTGGHPYRGTPGALLGHQTASEGRRPIFPPGTPQGYRDLAERCWSHDPAARPSFSQILDALTALRAEIPGPSQPLAAVAPLAKRMAAAMAADRAGAAGGRQAAAQHGSSGPSGGAHGGPATAGGGGSLGGSASGSGFGLLHKLGNAPSVAIQVGSRILSLSAAIQSADNMQSRGGLETIAEEGSSHHGTQHAGEDGGRTSNGGRASNGGRPSDGGGGGAKPHRE